jgi:hypothetical protein
MRIDQLYRKRINKQHKKKITRIYFSLYAWFWFHTEFWIKDPEERRPYTYIMRDWIYPHIAWFLVLSATWFIGMFILQVWRPLLALSLTLPTALLWAHLVWGSKWIKSEQEWPPVLDI